MKRLHRLIALPFIASAILCTVFLLPDAGEMEDSAICMDLPDELGGWLYQKRPPSEDEIRLLAKDTTFSKAICYKLREGEFHSVTFDPIPDRIDLSIVLSGHNLNDSIHRPERCMPTQGHEIKSSSSIQLELANGRFVPAQRLLSVQSVPVNEDYTKYASYQCVTYYFFVGHDALTNSHYQRTFMDMKDRLLFGMDQHWAYVSCSMWYGNVPWIENEVTLEEADQKLQDFISEFSAKQIEWEKIK